MKAIPNTETSPYPILLLRDLKYIYVVDLENGTINDFL